MYLTLDRGQSSIGSGDGLPARLSVSTFEWWCRFLCDTSLGGGSWVFVPAEGPEQEGYSVTPPRSRKSSCQIEVSAPWRALHALSPDATQLADAHWAPEVLQGPQEKENGEGRRGGCQGSTAPGEGGSAPGPGSTHPPSMSLRAAAALASRGFIVPLRQVTLDVLMAPKDCTQRTPYPTKDPIIAISCTWEDVLEQQGGGEVGVGGVEEEEEERMLAGDGVPEAQHCRPPPCRVVFLLQGHPAQSAGWPLASLPQFQAESHVIWLFGREQDMLMRWQQWMMEVDPDCICTYQVRDNLAALQQRCQQLGLPRGSPQLSRLLPSTGSAMMEIKSIVMYSVAWVKQQARMASTSNQETFRALVPGRLVFDVLRQVLTSQSLSTFSLVDCCQSLLNVSLEVISPLQLAQMWKLLGSQEEGEMASTAVRLARYALKRVDVVRDLMAKLATLTETFEMARATGLTIPQVLYNAQMIRTWSLLLRTSHRLGYIVSGRQDPGALIESPYLMHPVENHTVALYRQPVVTLDFASLYPSIYRAYNLCYTTLLHPTDLEVVGRERCHQTPSGSFFVKPSVRPGILPQILAALMTARTRTREALKHTADATDRAVLDGRQKALKLTANALYGFTGASASPLQCVPLADSCLAYGAHTCRRAVELIQQLVVEGQLGPKAEGGRVIYGQTDSVFIHFPGASPADAVELGSSTAALVSAQFLDPIQLKYERVMCPFMLLHVNRYAGKAYEDEVAAEAGNGKLVVKGIKSMWRQSAPYVSGVLQGCLEYILLRDDMPGAVRFAESEISRLMAGRVELWELTMTGGLWRVTGQQVAAAADGGDEDVRGPHATLAVKLSQRDPDRKFLLGERLPYVLLTGARLQDDAAEDPLFASQLGLTPNYELYLRNKLMPPLTEVLSVCVSPATLQALLSGPHALVRPDPLLSQEASNGHEDHPLEGSPPAKSLKKGLGRQRGMTSFFKQTVKCLGCRQVLPGAVDTGRAPGLCADCRKEEGKWIRVYMALLEADGEQQQEWASAMSHCIRCHSGGCLGQVVCENAECPVFHVRLASFRRLANVNVKLLRMDW